MNIHTGSPGAHAEFRQVGYRATADLVQGEAKRRRFPSERHQWRVKTMTESFQPAQAVEQPNPGAILPSIIVSDAHKLEKIADKFLSGDDEAGSFQAWHSELQEIAKHGPGFVSQVFKQMKSDCAGLNPLLPHVLLSESSRDQAIVVTPSLPNILGGLNFRSLSTSVDNVRVMSVAHAGRNSLVGHHTLAAYSSVDSQ